MWGIFNFSSLSPYREEWFLIINIFYLIGSKLYTFKISFPCVMWDLSKIIDILPCLEWVILISFCHKNIPGLLWVISKFSSPSTFSGVELILYIFHLICCEMCLIHYIFHLKGRGILFNIFKHTVTGECDNFRDL